MDKGGPACDKVSEVPGKWGTSRLSPDYATNNYKLACYSAVQTATTCGTTTAPLLGVYSPLGCDSVTMICSTGGSAAVVAPPSRAAVTSTDTGAWTAGTPVCRNPSSPSGAITETSGAPCQIGQAVGVAVGDYCSTCTTHLVDLDFAPQGATSSGNVSTYATAASSLHGAASGNLLVSDGSGNVGDSGVSDGFTTVPYIPQVIGVIDLTNKGANNSGNIVSSTPATGAYNIGGALYGWTAGSGCSVAASVKVTIAWTQDDGTSASVSFTSPSLSILNSIPSQVSINQMISAKTGTPIQYNAVFTAGTCTTQPTYALRLRGVRE